MKQSYFIIASKNNRNYGYVLSFSKEDLPRILTEVFTGYKTSIKELSLKNKSKEVTKQMIRKSS